MRKLKTLMAVCALGLAVPVYAGTVAPSSLVTGGTTTVLFGNKALDSLGLKLTGASETVEIPGVLGPNSAGFTINPRDAGDPLNPTTFEYDNMAFAPFSGTIEHEGTLSLTDLATESAEVTVGNFRIAYDAARVAGDASGFYVESTTGIEAILFDIGSPLPEAFPEMLIIAANILVSPEFSDFLQSQNLVDDSVAGADAGLALVMGSAQVVPVPAAVWLFGSALGLLGWIRRRAMA